MRRRNFITLIGGAAAWPVVARAQQPPTPVIALLSPTSFEPLTDNLRGFRQGLKEAGLSKARTYRSFTVPPRMRPIACRV
jgi:putative tryptophan/tyrosine transport system substrate-binding protein